MIILAETCNLILPKEEYSVLNDCNIHFCLMKERGDSSLLVYPYTLSQNVLFLQTVYQDWYIGAEYASVFHNLSHLFALKLNKNLRIYLVLD
jgi:hypothetical protein